MTICPHCGQTHGPDNHFCGVTGQPLDLGPRLLGQVLLDRFEVKALVGEGPLAVVLRATDRREGNKDVAVKMLHPRFSQDAAATERFLTEARRVGELRHPNLVPVLGVGRDPGGAPVVIREFLKGVCLAKYVRDRGPMPVELAAWVLHGVLAGLRAVHEAGLCNGDLTADDIFLTRGADDEMLVRLLDFGEVHFKRAVLVAGLAGPELGRSWAPEQVRSGIVNERSDIFAAGAVLYQTVTGKQPYPDGIPPAPQVIPIPPNPSSLQPSINRKVDVVVRRAMGLLPTDRYATAAAFAEALAPFVPPRGVRFDWDEKGVVPAPLVATPGAAGAAVAMIAPPAVPQPPAAPRGPLHKMTLLGAPAAIPGSPGFPLSAEPEPAASTPSVDVIGPTQQMPVMDAGAPAQPAAAAPARPVMVIAEPELAKTGGGKKWLVIVLVLVVLAVAGVIIVLATQGGGEAATGAADAGTTKAAEAAVRPAADAGAGPVAEAAAAAPEAAAPAVDAGAAVDAVEAVVDVAAEAAAEAVKEAAAPDAGPDVEPEAGPAEDAAVEEAAPDIAPADEAAAPEAARPSPDVAGPEAAVVRDAARPEAAVVRDAGRRDAVRPPADRPRVRDAGPPARDGRRGLIRDVVF